LKSGGLSYDDAILCCDSASKVINFGKSLLDEALDEIREGGLNYCFDSWIREDQSHFKWAMESYSPETVVAMVLTYDSELDPTSEEATDWAFKANFYVNRESLERRDKSKNTRIRSDLYLDIRV